MERLLSRYLAPYVVGISKDRLSVAVWSGYVELKELHVKPEVSDLLGIPFKVVWGLIGKITLKIPWASLGSSPVCVEIQDVYLLLEPRPIPHQGDAELQQQLRQMKMQQVETIELQLREIQQQMQQQMQQQTRKEADGGFFFRLANKVLSTLQVGIRNIHVALVDHERGFKVGILLAQMSLHNTDETWRRRQEPQQQRQQDYYKACELSGLAVYCLLNNAKATGPPAGWATPQSSLGEETEVDAEMHLGASQAFVGRAEQRASPPASPRGGDKNETDRIGTKESDALEEMVSIELQDEDLAGNHGTPNISRVRNPTPRMTLSWHISHDS